MSYYCWFCYWGWPKPVADIYEKYVAIAGEPVMHWGPAHIVWEEENFHRDDVQWCLDNFGSYPRDFSDGELSAVKESLEDLLKLPDEVLYPVPPGYDEDDEASPESYPPPADMVMVNKHGVTYKGRVKG